MATLPFTASLSVESLRACFAAGGRGSFPLLRSRRGARLALGFSFALSVGFLLWRFVLPLLSSDFSARLSLRESLRDSPRVSLRGSLRRLRPFLRWLSSLPLASLRLRPLSELRPKSARLRSWRLLLRLSPSDLRELSDLRSLLRLEVFLRGSGLTLTSRRVDGVGVALVSFSLSNNVLIA